MVRGEVRDRGRRWSRRAVLGGLASLPAAAGHASATQEEIATLARSLNPQGPLRVLVPIGAIANVRPVAQHFSQLSGIEVELVSVGIHDVTTTLILEKMQSGIGFDVALPPTYDISDLIAARAIRPLSNTGLKPAHSGSLYDHGNVFDGKRYGYQTDGDQYLMFYNLSFHDDGDLSKSWEDRHQTPFSIPRSWSELDAQVKHVSVRADSAHGGLFRREAGFIESEFWLRLHALGVWPLSPDFEPQIDSDEGVAALQAMTELEPFLFQESRGKNALQENWEAVRTDRVYASLSWGGMQKYLRKLSAGTPQHLAFASPPGGPTEHTPTHIPFFNWGWSYTVAAGTAHAGAASAFAQFATLPEPSLRAIRAENGFFDPFLPEHYSDAEIEKVYGREFLDVHRQAMEASVPDFYVARRGEYMTALAKWLILAVKGRVAPREALASAAEDWRLITSAGDRAAQINRWQALRQSYPKGVSDKLRDTALPSPQEG